jgi:hypothetical protein
VKLAPRTFLHGCFRYPTLAFHYGAGSAIQLTNMVSDVVYEMHGQCLLGLAEVDPMG